MHDERGTMQTPVFDMIFKGYKALENHALYPAKCQLCRFLRSAASIQLRVRGLGLIAR